MSSNALRIDDLPHYSYDDYVQWEGNWEIINGIPYAMTPSPSKKHQLLILEIASQLKQLLARYKKCRVYLSLDWQISEDTVVQPDISVVCDDDLEDTKLRVAPVLIFEILSPATSRKDRILKYRLYQDAGVKYYCLVNQDSAGIEVFVLNGSRYDNLEPPVAGGKILFDLNSCGIVFEMNELFNILN